MLESAFEGKKKHARAVMSSVSGFKARSSTGMPYLGSKYDPRGHRTTCTVHPSAGACAVGTPDACSDSVSFDDLSES